MPDLIPHHVPRTHEPDDKGWIVTEYRGAVVRSWRYANILQMPSHPYDGKEFGQLSHVLGLIDHWLDHQALPRPYVWPVPDRKAPRA
ncbi:hypothetical protein [Roseomonas haemaphysalidis]|uniref:Uncharacterized protein n=1 Tax=Roseomonas haemaphysalidis TaxID=2768162 RepID=A0ABS3KKW8_9PROT|nr:hypothetical protein [Roseomonas haemaphysalidis]MBO1078112.1 hypothetical protein [Roseomonas haemaphysalidis]